MKNYFIMLLFAFSNLFSQSKPTFDSIHKNEIRINVARYAFNSRVEVSYERFLTDILSVGITSISQEDKFRREKYKESALYEFVNEFQVNPFFRYSESSNKSNNFYVEAFSSINGGRYKVLERINDQTFAYYTVTEKKYLKIALGASVGYKFYVFRRISFDAFVGAAANLKRKNTPSQIPDGIARIGITIGYKF